MTDKCFADDHFVPMLSDANLARYGIKPQDLVATAMVSNLISEMKTNMSWYIEAKRDDMGLEELSDEKMCEKLDNLLPVIEECAFEMYHDYEVDEDLHVLAKVSVIDHYAREKMDNYLRILLDDLKNIAK